MIDVEKLENGYHILEAKITTTTGVKDFSYARIFIQKENPYLINGHAHDIANRTSYKGGNAQLLKEYKKITVSGGEGMV